jgi:hypothetical protein
MLAGLLGFVDGMLSLFALVYAATIVWEAVARARAGPVRFRLPLASLAKRGEHSTVAAYVVIVVSLGLAVAAIASDGTANSLVIPIWLLWSSVNTLSVSTRRDAKRWPVLTNGSLVLVLGAVALATGLQTLGAGVHSPSVLPGPLMLTFSAIFFVIGAAAVQEYVTGTRVRERGIEMFWFTRPWSRIVVKDWRTHEGGFDLYINILCPQLFGFQYKRDGEVIVPVPAAERPALEIFLAGHTTTARQSRLGEDVSEFPESFFTNHGQSDA